jgi:hypothetical protein
MAQKWRTMVNPWDNPGEGPPLDTVVEIDCCGSQGFIKFLPERRRATRRRSPNGFSTMRAIRWTRSRNRYCDARLRRGLAVPNSSMKWSRR